MKKIISVLLCLAMLGAMFVGCAKQDDYKCDIVLITDGETINDDGYNKSAWEGITSFANDNGMTARYYQPVLDDKGELTSEIVEKYVDLAAKNGAQYVVFPGADFAVPAYEIATSYPDLKFILVDTLPKADDADGTSGILGNVMSISFDELQCGFLAGYLAVLNGNTDLGFFGEYKSVDSASYGAGFVQGAGWAADTLGVPVKLSWADYDSPLVDYNYDFKITACYDKIDDIDEDVFKVNVVDGIGTGVYTEGSNVTITANPAPVGKVFDHWEVKSDTEGVKDKKVNISSKKEASMNLVVEKCDCTITAVYKDMESDYKTVTVMDADGKNVYAQYGVEVGQGISVKAPVAQNWLTFDKWESSADLGETDLTSSEIWVDVNDTDITLTPTYKSPEKPSFNVTVVTGEGGNGESSGSGSYQEGESVELKAAVPAEGYMFSHWENADIYDDATGISMENEYYWNTSFEMVDRFASICETMFDSGVDAIFDGGNSSVSAYTAKWNFDYNLNVISAGENNKDAYTTIIKNYGDAIYDALSDFKGGSIASANCATESIYASFTTEAESLEKKEERTEADNAKLAQEKEKQAKYDEVYNMLKDGEIKMLPVEGGAGYDFCKLYNEQQPNKNLTLDAWFLEAVEIN